MLKLEAAEAAVSANITNTRKFGGSRAVLVPSISRMQLDPAASLPATEPAAEPPALPAEPASTPLKLDLEDVEATERLGAQLAAVAQRGDVFFLIGELGAGKTSLARGFLRHFFADSQLEVPSPSYLLCFGYTDEDAPTPANGDAPPRPTLGRALNVGGSARLPGVSVLHLDPYRRGGPR